MNNFNRNQELINSIGGNVMAWKADEKFECSCKNGKLCDYCQKLEDEFYEEE